tara:strand:+ start:636 stop:887 length:252 start_codon:yes stop_codon:yes gene_type:complete
MKCPYSQYKYIFGKPNEGVHSIRFGDTAIVDYLLTIFLAMITTLITKIPLVLTTIVWLIIGIILHFLFGIQTAALKYLGIKCQ